MKKGFTLIEILTVIVALGVLAAIAIPSWRQHTLRSQRAVAQDLLVQLQVAQERFFGRNARYATASELSAPEPAGLGLSAVSANARYRLTIDTAADGLAYSATARATSGQAEDTHCAAFTIDQLGMRTAVDAAGADRSRDCWR